MGTFVKDGDTVRVDSVVLQLHPRSLYMVDIKDDFCLRDLIADQLDCFGSCIHYFIIILPALHVGYHCNTNSRILDDVLIIGNPFPKALSGSELMEESSMHRAFETGYDLLAFCQLIIYPDYFGCWIAAILVLRQLLQFDVKGRCGGILLDYPEVGIRHEEYLLLLLEYTKLADWTTC